MADLELVLIRHGQTRANLERRFCGRTDWPLLPQAYQDLKRLSLTEDLADFDIVCHTGLQRTRQTAEFLFPGRSLVLAPALAEFDFGKFEAATHEELRENPDYIRWLDEFATMACPGGESQPEFLRRVRTGWQELTQAWLLRPIKKAALVTHGGVISILMQDWFPEQRDLLSWQPVCGTGYRVSFSTGCPVCFQSFGARMT